MDIVAEPAPAMSRSTRLRRALRPMRDSQIRRISFAYAISSAGNYFTSVAISFAVLGITHSARDIGLVLACRMVPSLVLTLVGGVWADRLPRNRLMAASDVASAVAIGVAAIMLITGSAQVWSLGACMTVVGMAAAFFGPSTIGLVRDLVSDDQLQATNALLSSITSAVAILGPVIAGVMVSLTNPGIALAVDAASFLISAALLGGLAVPKPREPRERSNVWHEVGEGYREVRGKTWLMATILQMAIFQFTALACVNTLGPLVAEQSLGGARSWGLIVTGFAAGTLIGGVAAGLYHPSRLLVASMLPALLALPTLLLLARGGPVWALMLSECLIGAGVVFSNTVYTVALQQFVPADKLSRVYSFDYVGSSVLYPLGLTAAGPLAVVAGLGHTLLGAGLIVLVTTLVVVALPQVRRLRRLAEQPSVAT